MKQQADMQLCLSCIHTVQRAKEVLLLQAAWCVLKLINVYALKNTNICQYNI